MAANPEMGSVWVCFALLDVVKSTDASETEDNGSPGITSATSNIRVILGGRVAWLKTATEAESAGSSAAADSSLIIIRLVELAELLALDGATEGGEVERPVLLRGRCCV